MASYHQPSTLVHSERRASSLSPPCKKFRRSLPAVTAEYETESEDEVEEMIKETSKEILVWRRFAFHEQKKIDYFRVHGKERPYDHQCWFLDYSEKRMEVKHDMAMIKRRTQHFMKYNELPIKISDGAVWSRTPSPPRAAGGSQVVDFSDVRDKLRHRVAEGRFFRKLAFELGDVNDGRERRSS